MQRLDELPVGESITLCLYGGAGSGKTWLLGTLGDRTLYCNLENRLATYQSPGFKAKYKFNPLVISVNEGPVPDDGAKALVELTKQINEGIDKYSDQFDILAIDGSSALRRFGMNMGLELNQKTGKSKSLANKKQFSPEFPITDITVQDYTMEMNLIEKFIIQMKEYCFDAKKHFVLSAHERIEYNKPSAIGGIATVHSIRPGFTGQTFPDAIPGLFDLVWHTETIGSGDRVQYFVRTAGDSGLVAKTCYNGLFPIRMENVNLLDVFSKIKGR